MSSPRPFIIILVLAVAALVALFVVGVALGVGDARRPPSAEERLSLRDRWLGRPPPVAASELVSEAECAGTPQRPAIVAGRTCRLRIAPADARLRLLTARTRDKVHLVLTPAGEAGAPIDVELRAGQDNKVDLVVDKEGATLELTCQQAPAPALPCRVVLE